MGRDTLLLIDGHALVYRAFFAMPALSNSRGEVTNAAFGFTSMLLKAFTETRPMYAIAAFDLPGPTFRHDEFAEYKAHRPPMPGDLRPQLPWCREITQALNIPIVEVPGYEADDVIGALSVRAEEAGLEVVILTGDLDALQLVTPHVRVFASRRGITDTIIYDEARVRERFGFEPPLVADFKALQGDVTDNIPGVPGIGEKTAMALIQEYGALESVLAAVPAMKEGKVKRVLTEHGAQARHSKRMATIRCDLGVTLDLHAARLADYDEEAVVTVFDRLEFRSLLGRLPRFGRRDLQAAARVEASQARLAFDGDATGGDVEVVLVEHRAMAEDVCVRLRDAGDVCVRTVVEEPARRGEIVGVALCGSGDPSTVWYLPAGGDGDLAGVAAALLADPGTGLIGYDLKREVLAWRRRGVVLGGLRFDALLGAYLCNTRNRVPPLTFLAQDLCGIRAEPEEAIFGSGRSRRGLDQLEVGAVATHFGRWTALLPPVVAALEAHLAEGSLRALHDQLELPLVPVLAAMEAVGIAIDCDQLFTLSAELHQRIGAIEAEVGEIAGYTFNLGSTQQLSRFLFEDLGLAVGRRTKTGRSTDADTLEALRGEHRAVELVLEWRQLTKLKGTYVDALPLLCTAGGRIHTSFNQAVATTGRLSSADPNLQNVPVRSEWGQRIRRAFVADPNQVLISADYSQIELRVLAHVSGETGLIEAFRAGEDIHRRTAAEVAGIPPEAVTAEMRRNAKVVNFGVLYGLSDFGLARDSSLTQEAARDFIAAYFASFPAVTAYLERVRNHAREWGWVDTFMGRRRYLPDIRAANRQLRQAAERMAVNMPIQGGAADIMKVAMLRTDAALSTTGLRARLLLQVHDELVLEAPEAEVGAVIDLVRHAMSSAADLVVPLDVDVKVGQNWQEMALVPQGLAGSARAT